jgi:N4-gp56 family major capsid protein
MANLTQTALSDAIKTQYERRLLTRAVPRLVHGRWGMTARLNKYGSYELRKYGSLSAVTSALTEGTTPAEQSAPSLTLTTITPLFYGSWLGHTDELEMTVFDPLISEMSSILGEQAGVSADTLIRNTLTAGATKDYSNGKSDRTSLDAPADDVDYSDFIKQLAALEAADALPVDGEDFICILHPHTWASLMQDDTFVNMFQHEAARDNNSPIRSGYVGRVLRCKLFVTSNAREYADGGAGGTTDVYSMLFIGREAYGYVGMAGITPSIVDNQPASGGPLTGKSVRPVEIIVKPLGSAGADDPLNQRATVGWKMALATAVTNSAWVRDLEHTNAFSDL